MILNQYAAPWLYWSEPRSRKLEVKSPNLSRDFSLIKYIVFEIRVKKKNLNQYSAP